MKYTTTGELERRGWILELWGDKLIGPKTACGDKDSKNHMGQYLGVMPLDRELRRRSRLEGRAKG